MKEYNIDPEILDVYEDIEEALHIDDIEIFDTDKACKECTDDGNCSDVECPFYHHQLKQEDNK